MPPGKKYDISLTIFNECKSNVFSTIDRFHTIEVRKCLETPVRYMRGCWWGLFRRIRRKKGEQALKITFIDFGINSTSSFASKPTKATLWANTCLSSSHTKVTSENSWKEEVNLSLFYTQPSFSSLWSGPRKGGRTSSFVNPIWKHLHTEEVSEGGGGALPEVLPAQVVLLRSLHVATLKLKHQTLNKKSSVESNPKQDVYLKSVQAE